MVVVVMGHEMFMREMINMFQWENMKGWDRLVDLGTNGRIILR
jgi:hypothetical protein